MDKTSYHRVLENSRPLLPVLPLVSKAPGLVLPMHGSRFSFFSRDPLGQKKEMSKGFADQQLLKFVESGDWTRAQRWMEKCGGRHRELWTFLKHWESLGDFPPGLKHDLGVSHSQMGYVELKPPGNRFGFQLGPIVSYRAGRARRAAVAVLSLKRRGLLSKDMSNLIARMIYQPYESRYSEKWGSPSDWTAPIVKGIGILMQTHLKLVEFLPFLMLVVLAHIVWMILFQ
jgi:hypothetical protein